jgi:uncharacterized phage protein (TIGR01671 family)
MSREIKFRAWDAPNNEMRYSDKHDGEFYINLNGVMYMYGIPKSKNQYFKSYDVMQFTGLQDKNGKPIFEGDILKSEFVNCYFAIEWNNGAACYDWYILTETKKQGASLAKSIEEAPAKAGKPFMEIVEVIGNIYENPELLTERL